MREKKTFHHGVFLLCFTTELQRLLHEPCHYHFTVVLWGFFQNLAPRVPQQPEKPTTGSPFPQDSESLSAWSAGPQQYETRVNSLGDLHHYSISGPSPPSRLPGASAQARADNGDKHCLAKLRLDWAQIGSW
jgi:hypothetical protein